MNPALSWVTGDVRAASLSQGTHLTGRPQEDMSEQQYLGHSEHAELLSIQRLHTVNLFNIEKRDDLLASTHVLSTALVPGFDAIFNRPSFSSLSLHSPTLTYQQPIAEQTNALIQPFSYGLNDCAGIDPAYPVNVDPSNNIFSACVNPLMLERDSTTYFGATCSSQLQPTFQPTAIVTITVTDNRVLDTPETRKALRAQFRQFLATCGKDQPASSERRRYPISTKHVQSNSTSTSVALVHTATKCRKC